MKHDSSQNPLHVLHMWYWMPQAHTWQPLSMCCQENVKGGRPESVQPESVPIRREPMLGGILYLSSTGYKIFMDSTTVLTSVQTLFNNSLMHDRMTTVSVQPTRSVSTIILFLSQILFSRFWITKHWLANSFVPRPSGGRPGNEAN